MKALLRKTISVLLASFVVFAGVFMFGSTERKDVSASSGGEITNIYYFTDYYPAVPYSVMVEKFPEYNIEYDHQYVDQSTMFQMVQSGYFDKFNDSYLVIIDIKSFDPVVSLLEPLFYSLHEEQGCRTMLICLLAESDFDGELFLNYVDTYLQDNFDTLRDFIVRTLRTQTDANDYPGVPDIVIERLKNSVILLDGNLINSYELTEYGVDYMCTKSPFLRILMEEIDRELSKVLDVEEYSNYSMMLSILQQYEYNIHFLVKDDVFYDLYNGDQYSAENVQELKEMTAYGEIFAIGFWELNGFLYDFLLQAQNSGEGMPVYVLEASPMRYSADGLVVIAFGGMGGILSEAGTEVIKAIQQI